MITSTYDVKHNLQKAGKSLLTCGVIFLVSTWSADVDLIGKSTNYVAVLLTLLSFLGALYYTKQAMKATNSWNRNAFGYSVSQVVLGVLVTISTASVSYWNIISHVYLYEYIISVSLLTLTFGCFMYTLVHLIELRYTIDTMTNPNWGKANV